MKTLRNVLTYAGTTVLFAFVIVVVTVILAAFLSWLLWKGDL